MPVTTLNKLKKTTKFAFKLITTSIIEKIIIFSHGRISMHLFLQKKNRKVSAKNRENKTDTKNINLIS